jgi:hypothetical protein
VGDHFVEPCLRLACSFYTAYEPFKAAEPFKFFRIPKLRAIE